MWCKPQKIYFFFTTHTACRPHETWLELHDDDGEDDDEFDDSLEDDEDDEDYIDDDDMEAAEEFQALKSVVAELVFHIFLSLILLLPISYIQCAQGQGSQDEQDEEKEDDPGSQLMIFKSFKVVVIQGICLGTSVSLLLTC